MRQLLIGLAALTAITTLDVRPSAAQEYPWCAQYGRRGGGAMNCGFATFTQCQWAVSGIGGLCLRNPRYIYGEDRPRPRKRVRRPN